MCIKRLTLVLILGVISDICTADDWRRPDYIVASFFEIALKNEHTAAGHYVRKWPAAGIRYHYIHRIADQNLHEQLTEMHLRHLQEITGLPIKPAKSAEEASLLIVFSREETLKEDLRQFFHMHSARDREYFFTHSVCLGRFTATRHGSIQKAVVIIPVDRARDHAKLVDCIVEELTQVLGLPNDSEKVFPSVFNDRSVDHLLSGLDYILLKILYDPRLRPGMDKNKALPLVKAIVADYARAGVLDRAELLVQQGGLYPLLN